MLPAIFARAVRALVAEENRVFVYRKGRRLFGEVFSPPPYWRTRQREEHPSARDEVPSSSGARHEPPAPVGRWPKSPSPIASQRHRYRRLPLFRCNSDVGGTLVALDELQRETRGGREELGIIGSARAGPNRSQFDPCFSLAPLVCRLYPAAICHNAYEGIRRRHTEPAKLAPLKVHRGIPHHVL